jgi:hypothetical protein
MKHVVSFSGGRTSAYMVYLMEKKRKNEGWEVEYVFCDTGAEHPKTYEFVKNVVKHFNINLTCLKAVIPKENGVGPTFSVIGIDSIGWDLSVMKDMVTKYGNFTVSRPKCTDRLKTIILDKWRKKTYGKGTYYTWLGMRIDEPRRLKFINDNHDLFTKKNSNPQKIRYLAEICENTKQDVIDWWSTQPFDLEIEEHLGNCVFCVKKSDIKIARAARDEPQLFNEWNEVMTGEHVRLVKSDLHGVGKIYRKWQSPEELIATFSDVPTESLTKTQRITAKLDEGGCAESCEAMVGQIEMFEEDA